jgi:16S rRNA (cytosine967-C5)-methyltransferase
VRQCFAVDWTRGPGEVPTGYDRALVDAPCSGLGTIGRRPEIVQRLEPDDVMRLAQLQRAIVRQVASRVRTGGRLVYAVCSVLREETDAVVDALAADEPGGAERLVPSPFDGEPARALSGEGTRFRLLPQTHGTDGYFVASFVVQRG